jgi:nucleoside-diphosphate-sugar epimerase
LPVPEMQAFLGIRFMPGIFIPKTKKEGNMVPGVVFVTGATGYIGCHMANKLLKNGYRVVALAREKDGIPPKQRLVEAISQVDPSVKITEENLVTISGCMEENSDLWLRAIRDQVKSRIDAVWHHAAIFKVYKSCEDEVKTVNIGGVNRMLDFVTRVNGAEEMPRYFHISTAYSNGKSPGGTTLINEEIKDRNTQFRTIYDWSKHEGECLVQKYQQEYNLDASILRPSIVVSNTDSKVVIYAAYYHVLMAFYALRKRAEISLREDFDGNLDMRALACPHYPVNIIPVDFVVEAMYRISRKPQLQTKELKIFNIVNEKPPDMDLLIRIVSESLNIRGITLVPKEDFDRQPMSNLEKLFEKRITFQAPYAYEHILFTCDNFREAVSHKEMPTVQIDEDFLRNINKNFLEVHEANLEKNRGKKFPEKN